MQGRLPCCRVGILSRRRSSAADPRYCGIAIRAGTADVSDKGIRVRPRPYPRAMIDHGGLHGLNGGRIARAVVGLLGNKPCSAESCRSALRDNTIERRGIGGLRSAETVVRLALAENNDDRDVRASHDADRVLWDDLRTVRWFVCSFR
jgi:hypothetical protein